MNYTEYDKIGRGDIVNKISSLVDNLQQDKYFCLALNGEWGSGKTYVMGMLQEKFKEHPEYIVINYNAWENNFYSDPLIAILYCLLDGIKDYSDTVLEVKKKLQKSTKKTFKVWAEDMIEALKDLGGKYAAIACAVQGIINIITTSGKLIKHEQLKDFISYRTLLEKVKTQLNKLVTTEMFEGGQIKLVVMVDEIDRCLPDEQLIVLERLHHMFEIKNCAVIVAMNRTQIIRVFDKCYGGNGGEYLRKFFDITFSLEKGQKVFFQSLLSDLKKQFKNFNAKSPILVQEADSAYKILEGSKKNVLDKIDNREIERYFRGVTNICAEFGWDKLDKGYVFFIVVASFIRRFISSDFLEINIIKENQDKISRADRNELYNYIYEYLMVSQNAMPKSMQWDRTYYCYIINCFNGIVYSSIYKEAKTDRMKNLEGGYNVSLFDCIKLREFILLYGGDKYASNEE